MTDVINSIN